jgi:hypothetical protein
LHDIRLLTQIKFSTSFSNSELAGNLHSALCRISAQYALLMLLSVLKHNPSRLPTVGGIGQGRRSLSGSVPAEPLSASQLNSASVSVDKVSFGFFHKKSKGIFNL